MYKSGANNVYIKIEDGDDGGQWNLTSTIISNDYQTITIKGTTDLYYKLEGTEYTSTGNPFSLQSKAINVSSVYEAGRQEGINETENQYTGGWYTLIGDSIDCLVGYFHVQTPLYYYDYDLGEYAQWEADFYVGGYQVTTYLASEPVFLYIKNS